MDVLFLGNPGSGKSTICRSLSGKEFRSGINMISGLTTQLQWESDQVLNVRYGDTPGLSDLFKVDRAASEVEKALMDAKRRNRFLMALFVISLNKGRLSPSDLLTIKTILTSIKLRDNNNKERSMPDNSFGIIINNFPRGLSQDIIKVRVVNLLEF
jgi:GTPase SAR1 family protein